MTDLTMSMFLNKEDLAKAREESRGLIPCTCKAIKQSRPLDKDKFYFCEKHPHLNP